jgi:hypothetical protein
MCLPSKTVQVVLERFLTGKPEGNLVTIWYLSPGTLTKKAQGEVKTVSSMVTVTSQKHLALLSQSCPSSSEFISSMNAWFLERFVGVVAGRVWLTETGLLGGGDSSTAGWAPILLPEDEGSLTGLGGSIAGAPLATVVDEATSSDPCLASSNLDEEPGSSA